MSWIHEFSFEHDRVLWYFSTVRALFFNLPEKIRQISLSNMHTCKIIHFVFQIGAK